MYWYYETRWYYESNVEFELGFTNQISFTSKSHNVNTSHNTHPYPILASSPGSLPPLGFIRVIIYLREMYAYR